MTEVTKDGKPVRVQYEGSCQFDFNDDLMRKKSSSYGSFERSYSKDKLFDYDVWIANVQKERLVKLEKTKLDLIKEMEDCDKEINELNEQVEIEKAIAEYELVS